MTGIGINNNQITMNLAPIVIFAYLRIDTLKQVVISLQNNSLAKESELYIYCDGVKNEEQRLLQAPLIEYINGIKGFKSVTTYISNHNKGLDPSIISGITEILEKHEKIIVLEDDVVTAPNFLLYMNRCLDEYKSDSRIMSVSGWGIDLIKPDDYPYDVYLFGRSSSWGWATWKDRWELIDWDIKDWDSFRKNKREIRHFNQWGGSDMFSMLKSCMNGGGMWDIRFCYNMFKMKKYSIIPIKSKTENIGFNELAIHCKPVKFKRFESTLDTGYQKNFKLKQGMEPDIRLIKQRLRVSSLRTRIVTRLRNIIGI